VREEIDKMLAIVADPLFFPTHNVPHWSIPVASMVRLSAWIIILEAYDKTGNKKER
jgi:hypothetical protein